MANDVRLTVRISKPDKEILRQVANRVCGGNQSQFIRSTVQAAAELLREQDAVKAANGNQPNQQQPAPVRKGERPSAARDSSPCL